MDRQIVRGRLVRQPAQCPIAIIHDQAWRQITRVAHAASWGVEDALRRELLRVAGRAFASMDKTVRKAGQASG